jgi:outer membrane protein assembly factor BamB
VSREHAYDVVMRRGLGIAATLCALALAAPAAAAPIVPTGGAPSLPDFDGSAATARPLANPTIAPQNPWMAANPSSNIHNDTWMTDAYQRPGPLGVNLQTQSAAGPPSLCGSLAFDSAGHIVSVCPSSISPPHARVFDPVTLETLADYELPQAPDPPGTKQYQNFSGGGYFFLDQNDRMWIPTKTDHIYVLAISDDGTSLTLEEDYDLTPVLDEAGERITSALPDFAGRIWFVTKQNGKVGVLNPSSGQVWVRKIGEEIENSFAVGTDGVYVVSDKRMYRFKAHGRAPHILWRHKYENSGIVKPSQVDAGSGTTPTIMEGGYVAITDNADPMNVVVYRTARRLHGKPRVVCEVPVFGAGKGATENSLITAGRSLIVENNYGYEDPLDVPDTEYQTEPGFVRVDVKRNGTGCRKRWTNHKARAPTVVPKLSTDNGLIYTYTMPPDPSGTEGYYWTAIDFRTGKTAWSKFAGSGLTYNNNYAGLALGADGTAYLGVIGGLIALRDG